MSNLSALLHRELHRNLREEGFRRVLAEGVFTEWRDNLVSTYAKLIRTVREAKVAGYHVTQLEHGVDWCNAAIHWLTVPDVAMQDYFLRADPELKNKLVAAVLEDGGMETSTGFFVELPPID